MKPPFRRNFIGGVPKACLVIVFIDIDQAAVQNFDLPELTHFRGAWQKSFDLFFA